MEKVANTDPARNAAKNLKTLLHLEINGRSQSSAAPIAAGSSSSNSNDTDSKNKMTSTSLMIREHSVTFLGTAIVNIYDKAGQTHKCRFLLDSGSQSNMMTTELSKKLKLPVVKVNTIVKRVEKKTSKPF